MDLLSHPHQTLGSLISNHDVHRLELVFPRAKKQSLGFESRCGEPSGEMIELLMILTEPTSLNFADSKTSKFPQLPAQQQPTPPSLGFPR